MKSVNNIQLEVLYLFILTLARLMTLTVNFLGLYDIELIEPNTLWFCSFIDVPIVIFLEHSKIE